MIDFILHIDQHIRDMIANYGVWTYGILFLIIFAETGFVVTPFLPGDSLLFTAGVFTGPEGGLNVYLLSTLLTIAAIAGDNINYCIGRFFGERLFRKENSRIFKKSNLDKTTAYFEKYGGKTLVMARWLAIVRTFAPFVAGMSKMSYPKFLAYSTGGGIFWVWSLVGLGHLLGKNEFVEKNLTWFVLAIILATIPMVLFETWRERRKIRKEQQLHSLAAETKD